MSPKRIVLVLMDRVQVYQTAKPHPLLSTYETTDNPLGLCCLSSERIAFPGRTVGHVQLIEISTDILRLDQTEYSLRGSGASCHTIHE